MLFGEGSKISETDDARNQPEPLDPALANIDYPHPYAHCIVLGLMMSQWYQGDQGTIALDESEVHDHPNEKFSKKVGKMSKTLRNYRSPEEIFDRYGADALRWYFFANQPPWNSIIYAEQSIKDSIPEFLLRLWNVFSFFTIYAEMDGFDPRTAAEADANLTPESLASAPTYRPVAERCEIDRWILSELNATIETVIDRMDELDNYNACQAINSLVDALSNWYVRRNRDRFWAEDTQSDDKHDAYWTLYEVLLQVTKLVAPFVPFLSETLWRRLTEPFAGAALASVHLCDYPVPIEDRIDRKLSTSMSLLREITSLGRAARAEAKLKVRLPLSKVEVVLTDDREIAWLRDHDDLVRDELNVKAVDYTTEGDEYVQYNVVPNFKRLGPRVGKQVPAVKAALTKADGNALLNSLQADGQVTLDLPDGSLVLDSDDIEVRLKARDGWAAAQGPGCVVVLNTEVTDDLRREGISKDVIRVIQNQRKAIDCQYSDRIEVGIETEDEQVRDAIDQHRAAISKETLAVSLEVAAIEGVEAVETEFGNLYLRISDSA